MEQILLNYNSPHETVAVSMRTPELASDPLMATKNFLTSPTGVLQGDSLTPLLFMVGLHYLLRISVDKIKESGFVLTGAKSRNCPAKTVTNADSADDLDLFAGAISETAM